MKSKAGSSEQDGHRADAGAVKEPGERRVTVRGSDKVVEKFMQGINLRKEGEERYCTRGVRGCDDGVCGDELCGAFAGRTKMRQRRVHREGLNYEGHTWMG